MRRTLLPVIVAIVSFAVTSVVLVGGFALVAGGRSTGPVQSDGAPSAAPVASEPATGPSSSPDVAPVTPSDSSTGPLGSVGIGFGPGIERPDDQTVAGSAGSDTPEVPETGILSQDFRKLGLDDPTTVIDESLPNACEVVGAPVLGPALCNDR